MVDDAREFEGDGAEEAAGEPPAPDADAASADDPVAAAEQVVEAAADEIEGDIEALASVDAVAAQRDEYLESLQRLQAEFQNYRRRVAEQQEAASDKAAERLVELLLPVLDAVDLALGHGEAGVEPIGAALVDVLRKEGLERVDPGGEPFDPNEHDAVMHEDGDGPAEVIDVLRPGYRWKGRLLRPAMVKVKGS